MMLQFLRGFSGNHEFLSNFWITPVTWMGVTYPSAEHAFQAGKTIDFDERAWVARQETPGRAKRVGRKVTLRDGWDEGISIQIMREVLSSKFSDRVLRTLLLNTYPNYLVETNRHHDNRWGDCKCGRREECARGGTNLLGVCLMDLRTEQRTIETARLLKRA